MVIFQLLSLPFHFISTERAVQTHLQPWGLESGVWGGWWE